MRGGRQAGDGGAAQADATLRIDAPPGQDSSAGIPATAGDPAGGERFGDLRLPGFHAVLAAKPARSMAIAVQDTACPAGTGHPERLRLVPQPASRGGGPPAFLAVY